MQEQDIQKIIICELERLGLQQEAVFCASLGSVGLAAYKVAVQNFLYANDFNNALKWLDYAILSRPDYYQAFYRKGEIYRLQGLYDKAIIDYTTGLKFVGGPDAINGLCWGLVERGYCFLKVGRYDEALGDFTRAMQNKTDTYFGDKEFGGLESLMKQASTGVTNKLMGDTNIAFNN